VDPQFHFRLAGHLLSEDRAEIAFVRTAADLRVIRFHFGKPANLLSEPTYRFEQGVNPFAKAFQLLANIINLFADIFQLLANIINPFADVSQLLANIINLFANVPQPLANVSRRRDTSSKGCETSSRGWEISARDWEI
jgi:hypothetical protein